MRQFERDSEILLSYWRKLATDAGGLPQKASFSPGRVKEVLPYLYIVERRAPDDLLIRLVGTSLDAMMGTQVTGINYLDLYPVEDRPFYIELYDNLCGLPCGSVLERQVRFTNGNLYRMDGLALPMADAGGEARFVVGVIGARQILASQDHARGGDSESRMLAFRYMDLGFGVPEKETGLPALGAKLTSA